MNLDGLEGPGRVRRFWKWWKGVARRIGDFQARALLSIFYYVVFAPFALGVRWLADPLDIKKGGSPFWQARNEGVGLPTERALKQF